jgi:hypothetical protein
VSIGRSRTLAGEAVGGTAGPRRRPATPAAEFAGEAKDGLPVTESHGKITKIKRRAQGLYLGARNGERSGEERDRRRGAAVAVVLRGGGAALAEQGGEVARGEEETLLVLYTA